MASTNCLNTSKQESAEGIHLRISRRFLVRVGRVMRVDWWMKIWFVFFSPFHFFSFCCMLMLVLHALTGLLFALDGFSLNMLGALGVVVIRTSPVSFSFSFSCVFSLPAMLYRALAEMMDRWVTADYLRISRR